MWVMWASASRINLYSVNFYCTIYYNADHVNLSRFRSPILANSHKFVTHIKMSFTIVCLRAFSLSCSWIFLRTKINIHYFPVSIGVTPFLSWLQFGLRRYQPSDLGLTLWLPRYWCAHPSPLETGLYGTPQHHWGAAENFRASPLLEHRSWVHSHDAVSHGVLICLRELSTSRCNGFLFSRIRYQFTKETIFWWAGWW